MTYGDYISRQEAIEIAMTYCSDDDGSCSKAGEDIRNLLDELEAIPSADVRPVVRGAWVPVGDEPYEDYECDVCGFISEATFGPGGVDGNAFKFCPNCGTDNRERYDG